MGRVNGPGAAAKSCGLHHRWIRNTILVVVPLAVVCVLAVTTMFAVYYYSDMEADLRYRARASSEFSPAI